MSMKTVRIGAWAAVAALGLIAAGVFAFQSFHEETAPPVAASAKLGTPFNLIDHNGAPITEKAFESHPTVLFFGFTHCPDVCPTSLHELSLWLDELGPEGETLRPFFVSVDPKRDTADLMKDYISSFSPRITGITGDPAEIERVLKAWRIFAKVVPLDDGDYTVDHTASILLIRPDGSFQGTIAYREDPKVAVQKLRRLATGEPS